jgi:predicted Zn-dependent protease
MSVEDTLHYDEPPAWPLPTRQTLGNILLKAGRSRDAEFLFRQDLARNPENGWSLYALAQALRGRDAMKDVAEFEGRYKIAFQRADVQLPLEPGKAATK